MNHASSLLDQQLRTFGRVVLETGGTVAMSEAKSHAEREYQKFKEEQKRKRQLNADHSIREIKAAQKGLGEKRRK